MLSHSFLIKVQCIDSTSVCEISKPSHLTYGCTKEQQVSFGVTYFANLIPLLIST